MQKYRLLDPARGLAALAVVFFHRGVIPLYGHPLDWVVRYGEVGANIFFVISGYVIYQSMERHSVEGAKGSWIFIRKRFRRIYPPFWASVVVAFVVASLVLGQQFQLRDYVSTCTLTFLIVGAHAPQMIYWTLVFEEQFYAVMALLIIPVLKRINIPLLLLSTPIAIGHIFGRFSRLNRYSLLPSHWFEFELGILVFFILHHRVSRWISIPIFAVLVFAGFFGDYHTIAPGLFAVIIVLCHRLDALLDGLRVLAPLRWLGFVSYSLYLIHLPAFAINDSIFRLGANHEYVKYFSGLLTASIMTGVFFWLFERPFLSPRQKRELNAPVGSIRIGTLARPRSV
jgi:peptidoglycan/LPS O-acetylase OafA/YrhL